MTTIRNIITLTFGVLSIEIESQNLVKNAGFEDLSDGKITAWESTAWTPDFFNAKKDKKAFDNAHCGTSLGSGFLGISQMGEVASTKLVTSLEKDQDYLITMFVQKPITFCTGGVKKITASFTKEQLPRKDGPNPSFYSVQFIYLYPTDFRPLKEKCKWVEFSAIYKAKGTELYFHVGDFRTSKTSKEIRSSETTYIDSLENSLCTFIHYDSISVTKILTGKDNPMVIPGIFFEHNKSVLQPASDAALDNLYGLTYRLKNYQIKIIGHTDNVGEKSNNMKLSKARANAVVSYLVKKGIPKSRLSAVGLGDSKPVADNSTEEGRIVNRRVEIELSK